jgi:murein DD-endopeptidase MepM/ murein hydrolase activator NlpD
MLPLTAGADRAPLVSLAQPHQTDAALPLPIRAPVSSPFGYRADPFSGAPRFHAGVDIAAAYGREVPSAGPGRVVFSGSQGGYGNTVVVEHANGIRTRYAHLSSIQVEVGTPVDAGTIVGRVGSSGRSTGPHLHFEVLQDGQPVNPAVAATRFAGLLKIHGVVADLPSSQPSVLGVAVGVDDEDSGQ